MSNQLIERLSVKVTDQAAYIVKLHTLLNNVVKEQTFNEFETHVQEARSYIQTLGASARQAGLNLFQEDLLKLAEHMRNTLEMRSHHDEDCIDQDEQFSEHETCECCAVMAAQDVKKFDSFVKENGL